MRERPISLVPRPALLLLALGLSLQIAWHLHRTPHDVHADNVPLPPSQAALALASFGEPIALSKVLMLYIQTFDDQAGISIPYVKLDFDHLQQWLTRILELDPRGQYPLFTASRLYAEVPDAAKQKQMLEFIHAQFLLDPERRWPWMMQAVVIARHRLHDLPLARKYAASLRLHATGASVPDFVQQIEAFILEDMGELQSAKIMLGALLQSGRITDPHELQFLQRRLTDIESKATKKQ